LTDSAPPLQPPVRTLGATSLRATPIGLGLAALGRPAYINLGRDADLGADRSVAALRRQAHEILNAAFDAGVRYFDVARSYGLAEEFLASWLDERRLAPGEATVASKWGYTYTAGWRLDARENEVKDHSLAALRRQYRESRDILGGRLGLYQIHSATLESGVLEDRQVLSELAQLRNQGLAIGLTTSGPRQAEVIRRSMAVEVDGVNPFATVQATWNLLEPSAGAALAEAHAAGLGVIVKEALANGRLTPRGAAADPAVRKLADRSSAGLDAVAIAAARANPWADVVLSGAVTVEQLQSNLGGLRIGPAAEDAASLARYAEPAELYWAKRKELRWA
jgi:aryl-alcohol dehydrogenase-like predicted oxidoreductase